MRDYVLFGLCLIWIVSYLDYVLFAHSGVLHDLGI